MFLFYENFLMAISSIRANKMRSILTMLGIIIGISSVITISSLGSTVQATMDEFFGGFGKNRVLLYVNADKNYFNDNELFSFEDSRVIKDKVKSVGYATPYYFERASIKKDNETIQLAVNGIDYNLLDYTPSQKIIYGRELTEQDMKSRSNVIVIKDELAEKLYYKKNAVGEIISFPFSGGAQTTTKKFKIVGVYTQEKTIFDGLADTSIYDVFIPATVFIGPNIQMDIMIKEGYDIAKETEKLNKVIHRIKKAEPKFYEAVTMEDQVGMINNFFGIVSLVLGAIAAISLLVGGIGIMNIMLVSVTERTKEIGIRKSLGARKNDILLQFLIESLMLSGLGGIIGTVLGIGVTSIVAVAVGAKVVIPITSVIVAVAFSAVVGIFFGLYPANKAAKLDPIDALRYE